MQKFKDKAGVILFSIIAIIGLLLLLNSLFLGELPVSLKEMKKIYILDEKTRLLYSGLSIRNIQIIGGIFLSTGLLGIIKDFYKEKTRS